MSRKHREFELRDRIDAWVAEADGADNKRWLALIVALPFICFVAADLFSPRSFRQVLALAGERPSPFERTQETSREPCVGDLVRMAGLPYFHDLTADAAPKRCTSRSNAEGYLDAARPGNKATRPIWVVGSSFMTAGSHPGASFGARLTEETGTSTRNRAWPGQGPGHAILRFLQESRQEEIVGSTVVWGLVQRELEAFLFGPLHRTLVVGRNDEVKLGTATDWRAKIRRVLHLPNALEGYLEETSVVRRTARRLNRYTIPARLDRGASSQVRVGWLEDGRVMLFLTGGIDSAYRGFDTRRGDRIVSVIDRVNRFLDSRGAKLVIVLIPDKFQTYLPLLRQDSAIALGRGVPPATPVTGVFAEALSARNIRSIDLLPALREHALKDDLPFRVEDTHWSDRGIELAARVVALTQTQSPKISAKRMGAPSHTH